MLAEDMTSSLLRSETKIFVTLETTSSVGSNIFASVPQFVIPIEQKKREYIHIVEYIIGGET